MAKLTTKRALVGLLFLAILSVALYSILLDQKTTSIHIQDRVLRSEAGRLVARSQFDFHHIVEQWIQPGGKKNHSTRRKERLIEDGHVVKEAFEYGESENEQVEKIAQNKLNFHHHLLVNISKSNLEKEKQLQPEFHVAHSNSLSKNGSSSPMSKDLKSTNELGDVEGDSKNEVNSDKQKMEFANLHMQKSDHGGTGNKQAEGGTVTDAQAKHRPLSEPKTEPDVANQGESKGDVMDAQPKHGPHPSELNMKPEFRNPHDLAPVRSDSESESNIAKPKNGVVLSEKPDITNHQSKDAIADTQAKHGGPLPESKSKPNSHDTQAEHRPISELKTKSGAAKQASVKHGLPSEQKAKPDQRPNGKSERATVDRRTRSAVTSRNTSKRYTVYKPPPKPKTELKSADSSVKVMTVNSHGHAIRVVKRQNSASLKTTAKQQKYATVKRVNQTHKNPAPPLVINVSSHNTNPLDQENFDIDSDPRYAHLPPAVKKKLAAIRKDRLKRIKFIRMIRKRCEGKKYCLQRVKSNERALHDNCFYEAILVEKNDGIELNQCQCSMVYTTGTRAVNFLTHGIVSSTAVSKARPLVALVSLPGSGNTWVRGLLEQATGYCTGSMWCDPILRAKQFCAEGVRSNTLVVKNHDPEIRWYKEELAANASEFSKPSFSSAIFVHRDPYEATIAEWNRALGYKVYNATKHNFTVAGIGYYNTSAVKDQHTVSFEKEAFGMSRVR